MLELFSNNTPYNKNYYVRRIHYAKDGSIVIKLLMNSFKETLTLEGTDLNRYLILIKIFRPLLWIVEAFHNLISRFSETFVLVEKNKIVGCLTVQKADVIESDQWLLCNVAFDRNYLKIDLSILNKVKTLFNAGLAHIYKKRGKVILADLRPENYFAYKWCLRNGFRFFKEQIVYSLKQEDLIIDNIKPQPFLKELKWLNIKSIDLNEVSFLDNFSYIQDLIQSTAKITDLFLKFKVKTFDFFNRIIYQYNIYRLGLWKDNNLVSLLTLKRSTFKFNGDLEVAINPNYRDVSEKATVQKILKIIEKWSKHIIFVRISKEDIRLGTELEKFNFKKTFIRHRLILTLI